MPSDSFPSPLLRIMNIYAKRKGNGKKKEKNSYPFLATVTHGYTPQGVQYRLEKGEEDLQEIKCHQWPVML